MNLQRLITLVDQYLFESLSKGSQSILSNKIMVAKLADAIRDDVQFNPTAFPPQFEKTAQKASDENLAEWFLEQLDRIESTGYDGRVYSRNGVNNLWVVTRYIAGSHSWEDIEGTLSMNLSKWYTLKNRGMLDAKHQDIQQFKSVRELGQYMVYHYDEKLKDLQQQIANAERKKRAKAIKLLDNEDYRIYIILNREASCLYGLGSNWCTANSASAFNWNSYADQAMLFQLYPATPKDIVASTSSGKKISGKERYQFGADRNYSFMDLADERVPPAVIREKFPYLGDDLITALTTQKEEITDYINSLAENPKINDDPDTKIKVYNVDAEIKKLEVFRTWHYFTDLKRPRTVAPVPKEKSDE